MERFELPCAPDCPFGKRCANKYEDGTCVERVNQFSGEKVSKMQSEKLILGSEIKFRTTDPDRKVYVFGGHMEVYKDFEIDDIA